MWSIAYALTHLGHDVTVHTNQRAGFITNDWRPREKPKVELDLYKEDIRADLYIGLPIMPNERAIKLATKYGGQALCCIFDSYPALKRANVRWGELPEKWPELNRDNAWILSLAEANVPDICDWCDVSPERIKVLYPCVNDAALRFDVEMKRRNTVVFISRLVPHKHLGHLVEAVEPLAVQIVAISSDRDTSFDDKVAWRIRVSDRVKFDELRAARCLCVPSTHEGFGMWAIEAWAAGIPVVCYDIPTIREVDGGYTYFAKPGDRWDLQRQLVRCLTEDKRPEPDKRFYFGSMIKRLEEILGEIVS